jgi:hypothetical protein
MKALRFLFFAVASVIVSCPQGFSQLEYFLPDSNAYFSISPFKFWFQGDTSIESKVYKKVYMQQGDTLADFTHATYYAALREDTL